MDLAGYRPTLGEVAGLFGKSSRWISDLRAKGEMPVDGATLGEFVAAFGSLSSAGGLRGKPIDAHKARSAAARADRDEMATALMRGDLLKREDVTAAVQTAFARARARLLALPSKAAPIAFAMRTAAEVQEKLAELVHEALAELAATIVEVDANAGAEETGDGRGDRAPPRDKPRDRGGGGELVAGDDAAATVDGQRMGGREPGAKPGRKRRAR